MAHSQEGVIVGNLGRDPETRTFPAGGQVTNITVATSEKQKDQNTGRTAKAPSGTASCSTAGWLRSPDNTHDALAQARLLLDQVGYEGVSLIHAGADGQHGDADGNRERARRKHAR